MESRITELEIKISYTEDLVEDAVLASGEIDGADCGRVGQAWETDLMTDRKAELARLCRLEIRKTSALSKSRMSEYGYHLVEAVVGRVGDDGVQQRDQ